MYPFQVDNAQFLAQISKRLACSLDWDVTLRQVSHAPLPELGDWCVVDILEDDASIRRVEVAHRDANQEQNLREVARDHLPDPNALEGVAHALRTGRAEVVDSSACVDGQHLQLLRALGSSTGIIAPLVKGPRVLGALSLGGSQSRDEHALVLVEEVASRCAQAVDNARLYRLARQAIEGRDTFAATVSHDLKNPLATIGAQAQLLRRLRAGDDDSPSAVRLRQGIARIEGNVERMSRMLDALLDETRLELGVSLELERTEVDLIAVAHRIAAEHQSRAPHHRIQVAGETTLVGMWDLPRIERVLDNLIGNAVKYSPDGGVVTIVCVRESEYEQDWAILSVRDQGLGIPAGDVGRIFERFRRAANVAGISGSGIGLATIRDIVEQHGGTIGVDSQEGHGSIFTVRLPLFSERR